MDFADAFDIAFAMKDDLRNMTSLEIPIVMRTDSLSLFDFITKAKITSEKPVMIDFKVVKDAYHRNELHNIGFNRSKYHYADGLTKMQDIPCTEKEFTTIITLETYLTVNRSHFVHNCHENVSGALQ